MTKKKAGQPTKYREEYCEGIIVFFDEEPSTLSHITGKFVPNRLPTFERYAANIGVHTDTLVEWSKVHPKFSVAYKKCKQLQKNFLIQNALNGSFQSTFSIFVAKNITDMRDQQQIEINEIPKDRAERDAEIKDLLEKGK